MRDRIRRLGLVAWLALLLVPAAALANDPVVLTDTQDARACLPLRDGRVVSATGGGVVIFSKQGRVERHLTALDGLPGTRALALHAATEGDHLFWVGTDRGVAQIDVATGQPLRVDDFRAGVGALGMHEGKLVAGVWARGVAVLQGDRWQMPAADHSARITSLVSHAGRLYVGTAGYGVRLLSNGRLVQGLGSAGAVVWSLASHDQRLWWGDLEGAHSWAGSVVASHASGHEVRTVTAIGDRLMLGSYDQGFVSTSGRRLQGWGMPEAKMAGAYYAHGILCAATTAGLMVAPAAKRPRRLRTLPAPTLGANDIAAVEQFGGKLWVGSFDKGLFAVSAERSRRILAGNLDAKVNALAAARNTLWVGTARGLHALDRKGRLVASYDAHDGMESPDVHSLTVLRDGTVAAGTGSGIVLISNGRLTIQGKQNGWSGRAIWSLAETDDGSLWMGTSRGLYRWRRAAGQNHFTKQPKRWSVSSGHLSDDWVTSIVGHGDTLYVGTYAHGVDVLGIDGDRVSLLGKLGGGYINLKGLSVEGGRLYAATMNGLLTRSLDSDLLAPWVRLRRAAPGLDVTARLVQSDGAVVVASRRGIAIHCARCPSQ